MKTCIVMRSLQAAERGGVWTIEDHHRLMDHIRQIEDSWARLVDLNTPSKTPIRGWLSTEERDEIQRTVDVLRRLLGAVQE